jgi:CheY-like chemotaxis protein
MADPELPPLILVTDDEPGMLTLLEEALSSRGYRVVTATNGREGLERIAAERPNLILLDMFMPTMDGWTFAKAIHERYGRTIPIVVITAAQDSRLRADEIGADGDLGKPFELEQLYDIVKDTIPDEPPR